MKFRTLVFDLDGTLVDSSASILSGFSYALEPFGIQVTSHELEVMRSMTSQELFRNYLSETDAQLALNRLWNYSLRSASETLLYPGIKPLLDKLFRENVDLALWTARDRASALKILQIHGLDQYFKVMVGGCSVKKNKPHPEGLQLIARTLNVPVESILHIGDHEHDLSGAKAVGATAIHAQWCMEKNSYSYFTPPDFSFQTVGDFAVWLSQV
jgi:HAD superfamily hydrolase (TIGR01549 family)